MSAPEIICLFGCRDGRWLLTNHLWGHKTARNRERPFTASRKGRWGWSQRQDIFSAWEIHTGENLSAEQVQRPSKRLSLNGSAGLPEQRIPCEATQGLWIPSAPSGLWHYSATDELWFIMCFFKKPKHMTIMVLNSIREKEVNVSYLEFVTYKGKHKSYD